MSWSTRRRYISINSILPTQGSRDLLDVMNGYRTLLNMVLHKNPGVKGSQSSNSFSSLNLNPRPTRVTQISHLNFITRKVFLKDFGEAFAMALGCIWGWIGLHLGSLFCFGLLLISASPSCKGSSIPSYFVIYLCYLLMNLRLE